MKNDRLDEVISEIDAIRNEIKKIEELQISPLKDKIIELFDLKINLEFEDIFKRIKSGELVGIKSHYCSPFYEFDYKEWKELGFDSPEEFILSCSNKDVSFITFDKGKIEKVD